MSAVVSEIKLDQKGEKRMRVRNSEAGGARAKLIVFIVIIAIVAYIGYLYIPVTFDAYYFRDYMQNKVDLAALQSHDGVWVKDQLMKGGAEYHVPDNVVITTGQNEGRMEVRVQFTRPISTPVYTYNYEFDYTAKSATFLTK